MQVFRNPGSISQPSAVDQTPAPINKPPPEDCIPARCPRPQYVYGPLEDSKANMRVIELLPGTSSDGSRIRILEAFIDSDVPYEALSYTWAPVEPARCIEMLNITVASSSGGTFLLLYSIFDNQSLPQTMD